jgi:hypothetical protein
MRLHPLSREARFGAGLVLWAFALGVAVIPNERAIAPAILIAITFFGVALCAHSVLAGIDDQELRSRCRELARRIHDAHAEFDRDQRAVILQPPRLPLKASERRRTEEFWRHSAEMDQPSQRLLARYRGDFRGEALRLFDECVRRRWSDKSLRHEVDDPVNPIGVSTVAGELARLGVEL